MHFRTAVISLLFTATTIHAFSPSLQHPAISVVASTKAFSALAVSADDINAKLSAQMQKLKEKDAASPSLSKNVSLQLSHKTYSHRKSRSLLMSNFIFKLRVGPESSF